MRTDRILRRTAAAAAIAAVALACSPESDDGDGVIVEAVGAALADSVQAGDTLLSWRLEDGRRSRAGRFETPFDPLWVAENVAPHGRVLLEVRRGANRLVIFAPAGAWGLEVRPRFSSDELRTYLAGRDSREGGLATWTALAESLGEDRAAARAWLETEIGARVAAGQDAASAWPWFEAAAARVRAAGRPRLEVAVWDAAGEAFFAVDLFDPAGEAFDRALVVCEGLEDAGLMAASLTNDLGIVAINQGRLNAAEDLHRRARQLWVDLAPGCRGEAVALNNLATIAQARGDIDAAEERFQRVLEISEGLEPGGMGVAIALSNLGAMAYHRGDLATAQERFERSLVIRRELAPDSLRVASTLNNLGLVALERGDMTAAGGALRDALELRRREGAQTLAVAQSLDNLGSLAWRSGDAGLAEGYYRQALELRERLAPNTIEVARSAANLSLVEARRGHIAEARRLEERALAIRSVLAPDSLEVALSLTNLASLAADSGSTDEALDLHRRALQIRHRLAPGSLAEAVNRFGLCVVLRATGRARDAVGQCEAALAIRTRLAPGSLQVAEVEHHLGLIAADLGLIEQARGHFLAALDAVEQQELRLGTDGGGRRDLTERIRSWYQHALGAELELGHTTAALQILERSRARQLRTLMASRDLVLETVPTELRASLRRLERRADQARKRLAALDGRSSTDEVATAADDLRQALAERTHLLERIRRRSPEAAGLRSPPPPDLERMTAALTPGALVLSYATSTEESVLFTLAVDADGPAVTVIRDLPGEAELGQAVGRLRVLVRSPGAGPRSREALDGRLVDLYRQILAPARDQIATSQRLIVVPDGPLRFVPFAALALDPASASLAGLTPGDPVVEWRPLRTVVSLQLHADLRPTESPSLDATSTRLLAVGDPSRTETDLPRARAEARSVASVVPGDGHTVLLGRRATEGRLRASARDADLIHLACHAEVDQRLPLETRLLLAPDEDHDGDLHLWEVFESVRTPARLVTLSACETGIGADGGSEGLIGLTRAFHFAGAPSVVSSLWPVDDDSTSRLMEVFYRHVAEGRPFDESLRLAQLELRSGAVTTSRSIWSWLRGPGGSARPARDLAHPYHWAGFQLSGLN